MDFGTGREVEDASGSDLTGTPLYLAPEVIRGEPATRQSDIYNLGVLLYHLLTGSYPVRGASIADLRRAHERGTRVALAAARPDLPRRLAGAIDRALDPRPERRQASADALGVDLARARSGRPGRGLVAAAAATLLVAGAASWFAATQTGTPPAVLAAHERPVIAVLPFANESSEEGSELFVDGLTLEIIRSLAEIEGLDVRSATSTFALKGRPRDVAAIGAQLTANLLLDGSVLRSGHQLRVHAQLVLVSSNVPVWSDRFDRTLDDVFAIQDEISRAIVNALRMKLGRLQRRYDTNPQLAERYLRARALVQRNGPGHDQALAIFQEVVAADPTFAPAHAGIASALAKQSLTYPNVDPTNISPEAANRLIRPAATKALELDPLLAEAHAAMGLVHATDLDWAESERAFRRALELNPGQSHVYGDFVLATLWPQGRVQESVAVLERAVDIDPLSPFMWRLLGRMQLLSGAYADALSTFDRMAQLDPAFPIGFLRNEAMVLSGRVDEAIAAMEKQGAGTHGVLGYAYAVGGRRSDAEALAARNHDFPQRQVLIYAGLGDADRMFDALDRLAAINARRALAYAAHPELDFAKSDPRMTAFRRRFGVR
jgi:TolB-like protein